MRVHIQVYMADARVQLKENGLSFLVVGDNDYIITKAGRQHIGFVKQDPFYASRVVNGISKIEQFHIFTKILLLRCVTTLASSN